MSALSQTADDRVAAEVHLVNAQRALLGLQAQFDWGSHDG